MGQQTKTAQSFLEFALDQGALQIGRFRLKSGRDSPYFFNTSALYTGAALHRTGMFYAQAIRASGISMDGLFGPAYKGISLACATAICLSEGYGINTRVFFNRKETKPHGEGGRFLGGLPFGRLLILDDVVTAGTSAHEAVESIEESGAYPVGLVIAFDRQEQGRHGGRTAVEEIANEYRIKVIRLAKFDDLKLWIAGKPEYAELAEQFENLT